MSTAFIEARSAISVASVSRAAAAVPQATSRPAFSTERRLMALFCYEDPESDIGRYAGRMCAALAEGGSPVYVFSCRPFAGEESGVRAHAVGTCDSADDLVGAVDEFTRRACNAFLRQFPADVEEVTLLGYEWSAVPALSLLHGLRNFPAVVSFHSLECERSDMTSEISNRIAAIELTGLREANAIVCHRPSTAALARNLLPECAPRIVEPRQFFPGDALGA
jgi:hypothetical protein